MAVFLDLKNKIFGGDDSEKNSESSKSESSASSVSTPEPPEEYVSPQKSVKKGAIEDVYPWIKLLPNPEDAEGFDENYHDGLNKDDNSQDEENLIDTRGMAPKNIDDRGRIRGSCTDCDCDEFERAPKGSPCHYCLCSPSTHELLWPPPPEENQPISETEVEGEDKAVVKEKDQDLKIKAEEDEEEEAKPPSKIGGFLANFKKKVKPATSEEEMEAAKQEELRKIKEEMEEEIRKFEEKKKKEFEKLKEVWSEMYFKSLPVERCSEDRRGIVRGRCRDCDCEGFESDLPASSTCAYCGCAPTYHVAKIDYFTEEPFVVHNKEFVNQVALKNWKRKTFAASLTNQSEAAESEKGSHTNEDMTVYQNQRVIDAADEGVTYKYDTLAEKNKADKNKATVAEIYPWIKEEAEPKRKITNLAQLVKDNKRKGLSKRHNLVLDLTEEVRTLRAEIEDVLFYDNEDTLQTVLQELWQEHHKLVQQFEEFMSDLTVDSPPPSPMLVEETTPTPEHVREDRAQRRVEWKFKNILSFPVDDDEADKEFEKGAKPNEFGM
ncbi:uncharacterized protein LOC134821910 isoform X2 [Bolinopsis microptera]|uniref:uncharacterized protein LOC134821910 isoform X2 n=1 Tax=Bolinopsis microptera TaxID=2820187 RepID=UPI00307AA21E